MGYLSYYEEMIKYFDEQMKERKRKVKEHLPPTDKK